MINDHQVIPAAEGKPFGAFWLITAPWAHPFWSQYWFSLADLTTPVDVAPTLARHGMTHELLVWVVNPDMLMEKWAPRDACLLSPPNQGYQFPAESDDAALARVNEIVGRIEDKKLSPDTDWSSIWDEMFADGVSLRYNIFERAAATVQ